MDYLDDDVVDFKGEFVCSMLIIIMCCIVVPMCLLVNSIIQTNAELKMKEMELKYNQNIIVEE